MTFTAVYLRVVFWCLVLLTVASAQPFGESDVKSMQELVSKSGNLSYDSDCVKCDKPGGCLCDKNYFEGSLSDISKGECRHKKAKCRHKDECGCWHEIGECNRFWCRLKHNKDECQHLCTHKEGDYCTSCPTKDKLLRDLVKLDLGMANKILLTHETEDLSEVTLAKIKIEILLSYKNTDVTELGFDYYATKLALKYHNAFRSARPRDLSLDTIQAVKEEFPLLDIFKAIEKKDEPGYMRFLMAFFSGRYNKRSLYFDYDKSGTRSYAKLTRVSDDEFTIKFVAFYKNTESLTILDNVEKPSKLADFPVSFEFTYRMEGMNEASRENSLYSMLYMLKNRDFVACCTWLQKKNARKTIETRINLNSFRFEFIFELFPDNEELIKIYFAELMVGKAGKEAPAINRYIDSLATFFFKEIEKEKKRGLTGMRNSALFSVYYALAQYYYELHNENHSRLDDVDSIKASVFSDSSRRTANPKLFQNPSSINVFEQIEPDKESLDPKYPKSEDIFSTYFDREEKIKELQRKLDNPDGFRKYIDTTSFHYWNETDYFTERTAILQWASCVKDYLHRCPFGMHLAKYDGLMEQKYGSSLSDDLSKFRKYFLAYPEEMLDPSIFPKSFSTARKIVEKVNARVGEIFPNCTKQKLDDLEKLRSELESKLSVYVHRVEFLRKMSEDNYKEELKWDDNDYKTTSNLLPEITLEAGYYEHNNYTVWVDEYSYDSKVGKFRTDRVPKTNKVRKPSQAVKSLVGSEEKPMLGIKSWKLGVHMASKFVMCDHENVKDFFEKWKQKQTGNTRTDSANAILRKAMEYSTSISQGAPKDSNPWKSIFTKLGPAVYLCGQIEPTSLPLYHKIKIAMFFSSTLFQSFESLLLLEKGTGYEVSSLQRDFDNVFFNTWVLYNMKLEHIGLLHYVRDAIKTILKNSTHYFGMPPKPGMEQKKDPHLYAFMFFMQRMGLLFGTWYIYGDSEVRTSLEDQDFMESLERARKALESMTNVPLLSKVMVAFHFFRGCITQGKLIHKETCLEANEDFIAASGYGGFEVLKFDDLKGLKGLNQYNHIQPIWHKLDMVYTWEPNYDAKAAGSDNICKDVYYTLMGAHHLSLGSPVNSRQWMRNAIPKLTNLEGFKDSYLDPKPFGSLIHTGKNKVHSLNYMTYTYWIQGARVVDRIEAILRLSKACSTYKDSFYCKCISAGISVSDLMAGNLQETLKIKGKRYVCDIFGGKVNLSVIKNGVPAKAEKEVQLWACNSGLNESFFLFQKIDSKNAFYMYENEIPRELFEVPSGEFCAFLRPGFGYALLSTTDYSEYLTTEKSGNKDNVSLSARAARHLGIISKLPSSDSETAETPMEFQKGVDFVNGRATFEIQRLTSYRGISLRSNEASIYVLYDVIINNEFFLFEQQSGSNFQQAVLLRGFRFAGEYLLAVPFNNATSILSIPLIKEKDDEKIDLPDPLFKVVAYSPFLEEGKIFGAKPIRETKTLKIEVEDRSDLTAFLRAFAKEECYYEALEDNLKKISFLTPLSPKELENLKSAYGGIPDNLPPLACLLKVSLMALLNYSPGGGKSFEMYVKSYRPHIVFRVPFGMKHRLFFGFVDELREEAYFKAAQTFRICTVENNLAIGTEFKLTFDNYLWHRNNDNPDECKSYNGTPKVFDCFFQQKTFPKENTNFRYDRKDLFKGYKEIDLDSMFEKEKVALDPKFCTDSFKIHYEVKAAEKFGRLFRYVLNLEKSFKLVEIWNRVSAGYKKFDDAFGEKLSVGSSPEEKRMFQNEIGSLKDGLVECFVKKDSACYKRFLGDHFPDIVGLHETQIMYYAFKSQMKHLQRIAKVCLDKLEEDPDSDSKVKKVFKEIHEDKFTNADALPTFPAKRIELTEDEARDFLVYPRKLKHGSNEEAEPWIAPSVSWTCLYAFESDSTGKTVRADQIEDVARIIRDGLLSADKKAFVLQKLMASGKTAIIGVLAVLLFKHHFESDVLIHMPPSFNFTPEILNYERGLRPFGIQPLLIRYSRELPPVIKDGEYVTPVIKDGDRVKSSGHETEAGLLFQKVKKASDTKDYFLVAAPETLLSMANLKILWDGENPRTEPVGAQKLDETLEILRTKGHVIIDELQLTADTSKSLIYTLKDKKEIDRTIKEMICVLFLSLASDPSNQFLLMNKNQFIEKKKDAAATFAKYFNEKFDDFLELHTSKFKIDTEMFDLDMDKWGKEEAKDIFLKYLPESSLTSSNNFVQGLFVVKKYLDDWIPALLNKDLDKDYGQSDKKDYFKAVPYVSANTPSKTSEFSDPFECYCRTLVMFLRKGLGEKHVHFLAEFVEVRRQNEIKLATGDYDRKDCLCTYPVILSASEESSDPKAKSNFEEIFGFEYREFNAKDTKMLMSMIRRLNCALGVPGTDSQATEPLSDLRKELSRAFVAFFATTMFIKDDKYNTMDIESNATALEHMFFKVNAYTGTLCGQEQLPTNPAVVLDEGGLGKIYEKLFRSNKFLAEIPDAGPGIMGKNAFSTFLEDTLEKVNSVNDKFTGKVCAIIDEMAYFKNYSNKQIAFLLMQDFTSSTVSRLLSLESLRSNFDGVLFFDNASGKPALLNRQFVVTILPGTKRDTVLAMTGLRPEKIFTFYDQSHITGVDITQRDDGVALMFVNFKSLAANALQGTMRMRKYFSGQNVFYLYPKSSHAEIFESSAKQSPTVMGLFERFVENEDSAFEMHFLAVGPQKLISLARSIVYEKDKKALPDDRVIFFHQTNIDVLSYPFVEKKNAYKVLKEIGAGFKKKLKDMYQIEDRKSVISIDNLIGQFKPKKRFKNYISAWDKDLREEAFKAYVNYKPKLFQSFQNLKRSSLAGGKLPKMLGESKEVGQFELERFGEAQAENETETQQEKETHKEKEDQKENEFQPFPIRPNDANVKRLNLLALIDDGRPKDGYVLDGTSVKVYGNSFICLKDLVEKFPTAKDIYDQLHNKEKIFISENFLKTFEEQAQWWLHQTKSLSLGENYQKVFSSYFVFKGNAYVLSPDDITPYLKFKEKSPDSGLVIRDVSDPNLEVENFDWKNPLENQDFFLHFSIAILNGSSLLTNTIFEKCLEFNVASKSDVEVQKITKALVQGLSASHRGYKKTLLNCLARRSYLRSSGIEGLPINPLYLAASDEKYNIFLECRRIFKEYHRFKERKSAEFVEKPKSSISKINLNLSKLEAAEVDRNFYEAFFKSFMLVIPEFVDSKTPLDEVVKAFKCLFAVEDLANVYAKNFDEQKDPMNSLRKFLLKPSDPLKRLPNNLLALIRIFNAMREFYETAKGIKPSLESEYESMLNEYKDLKYSGFPKEKAYFSELYGHEDLRKEFFKDNYADEYLRESKYRDNIIFATLVGVCIPQEDQRGSVLDRHKGVILEACDKKVSPLEGGNEAFMTFHRFKDEPKYKSGLKTFVKDLFDKKSTELPLDDELKDLVKEDLRAEFEKEMDDDVECTRWLENLERYKFKDFLTVEHLNKIVVRDINKHEIGAGLVKKETTLKDWYAQWHAIQDLVKPPREKDKLVNTLKFMAKFEELESACAGLDDLLKDTAVVSLAFWDGVGFPDVLQKRLEKVLAFYILSRKEYDYNEDKDFTEKYVNVDNIVSKSPATSLLFERQVYLASALKQLGKLSFEDLRKVLGTYEKPAKDVDDKVKDLIEPFLSGGEKRKKICDFNWLVENFAKAEFLHNSLAECGIELFSDCEAEDVGAGFEDESKKVIGDKMLKKWNDSKDEDSGTAFIDRLDFTKFGSFFKTASIEKAYGDGTFGINVVKRMLDHAEESVLPLVDKMKFGERHEVNVGILEHMEAKLGLGSEMYGPLGKALDAGKYKTRDLLRPYAKLISSQPIKSILKFLFLSGDEGDEDLSGLKADYFDLETDYVIPRDVAEFVDQVNVAYNMIFKMQVEIEWSKFNGYFPGIDPRKQDEQTKARTEEIVQRVLKDAPISQKSYGDLKDFGKFFGLPKVQECAGEILAKFIKKHYLSDASEQDEHMNAFLKDRVKFNDGDDLVKMAKNLNALKGLPSEDLFEMNPEEGKRLLLSGERVVLEAAKKFSRNWTDSLEDVLHKTPDFSEEKLILCIFAKKGKDFDDMVTTFLSGHKINPQTLANVLTGNDRVSKEWKNAILWVAFQDEIVPPLDGPSKSCYKAGLNVSQINGKLRDVDDVRQFVTATINFSINCVPDLKGLTELTKDCKIITKKSIEEISDSCEDLLKAAPAHYLDWLWDRYKKLEPNRSKRVKMASFLAGFKNASKKMREECKLARSEKKRQTCCTVFWSLFGSFSVAGGVAGGAIYYFKVYRKKARRPSYD